MLVHIREATPRDAAAIAEIHVTTWQTAYEGMLPASYLAGLSVDVRARQWHRSLSTRQPRVFVAESGDAIVGWVAFGRCRDADKDGSWGEVEALYVLPSFWRRGVGQRLMDSARRALSRIGYTDVVLWVLADNHRAIAFYRNAGFMDDDTSRAVHIAHARLKEVRYSAALTGPWTAASSSIRDLMR
ncbi:GNAT family N-acetyltransferase [Paraburkholderia phosphatilytica]|uniref:GNAT family N-acetyltransferase n=1 Tax=Paraburkholderia phosphatilytica TaxID=2282883 RepID=UPI000E4B8E7D|nr:GNAT family N-acetyltransferase [Paraburkholderia phosphatilytica]